MMNSSKQIEILKGRFLQTFAAGKGCTFHHDLAHATIQNQSGSSHRNAESMWLIGLERLNPTETLWSILKKRLGKKDYSSSTKECLITNVIKVWFHNDKLKGSCSKLMESDETCPGCHAVKGEYMSY